MGLFNRLFGNEGSATKPFEESGKKSQQESEAFFLDSDSSAGLGNLQFMRRSNQIRHTFPGNKDNPGNKEFIKEVASMTSDVKVVSEGLGGADRATDNIKLNQGVPNPPKKTFAEKMGSLEFMQKRTTAGAVAVNAPLSTPPVPRKGEQTQKQTSSDIGSSLSTAKPGSTDPFRNMAKDLNR
uniref:Uncharacterized protein n=1 Tax=Paulinella micropora TaxID=1928728 RepID=A0A385HZM4_9EUKA|nr:hypothetical protein PMNZ_145 [Paulinella micropora]AXY63101.1 hypothetical protein PMNZ_145 [Paulinella micropora]